MKMKIEPVAITITDNWRYCLVAWLIDRDDFLTDLQRVRKKLGINEKLVDYKIAKEWFDTEFEKEKKKTPIKKIPDPLIGKDRYVFPKTESEKLTTKLLEKYHKSPLYFETVRHAIVTGVVTNKELARTAFCQVLPLDYQMIDMEHGITNLVEHDQPVMAIVISPETKLEEIVGVFQKEVPHLRIEYVASRLKGTIMPPDINIINNVQRDRKWYWLKKQGMSYGKILNQAKEEGEHLTRDAVIKAIKRYKARVTVDI